MNYIILICKLYKNSWRWRSFDMLHVIIAGGGIWWWRCSLGGGGSVMGLLATPQSGQSLYRTIGSSLSPPPFPVPHTPALVSYYSSSPPPERWLLWSVGDHQVSAAQSGIIHFAACPSAQVPTFRTESLDQLCYSFALCHLTSHHHQSGFRADKKFDKDVEMPNTKLWKYMFIKNDNSE